MKETNQAAMNVLSGACELMATLAFVKHCEGSPALGSAVALAVQARLKLKDAVELFQEAHKRETGETFNSRCTWTFEMPPITPTAKEGKRGE